MSKKRKPFNLTPWMHVTYITCIFVIILTCVIICMSKSRISPAAFDNVTFAATLISIVLAVISIVVSVIASFSTNQNLGGMRDIEQSLQKIVSRLEKIENSANKANDRLADLWSLLHPATIEQIQNQIKPMVDEANNESAKSPDHPKTVFTVQDIMALQQKAVLKVAKEYKINDLRLNTRIGGLHGIIFDGIAINGDTTDIIEVKLYRPGIVNQVITQIQRKIATITHLRGIRVHLYLVFITPAGTDREAILRHIGQHITTPDITPLVYTFDQL